MSRSKAEIAKAKERARKRAARANRETVRITTDVEIPTVRLLQRVSTDLGITIGQVITEMIGDLTAPIDRWHIDAGDHPSASIDFEASPEVDRYLRSEPRYKIAGMIELCVLRRCRTTPDGRIEYVHPDGRIWQTSIHLVDRSEGLTAYDKYKNRREIRIRHTGTYDDWQDSAARRQVPADQFAVETWTGAQEREASVAMMSRRGQRVTPASRVAPDPYGLREAAKAYDASAPGSTPTSASKPDDIGPITYASVPAASGPIPRDPEIEEQKRRQEAESAKTMEALDSLTTWIRRRDAETREQDRRDMAAAAAARAGRVPEPVHAERVEIEIEDPAVRVHRVATAEAAEALAALATRAGEPGPRVPWRSPHAWREAPEGQDDGEVW
jgi:hypothetical protein